MEYEYEPRNIEQRNDNGVQITRWTVGPETDLSYIEWPRYMPENWWERPLRIDDD